MSALFAYRVLSWAIGPLVAPWLSARARAGKEDRARLRERLGHASAPRPDGPLVWLHGASVGESAMLRLLITALAERRPDLSFLLTTGTMTSADLAAKAATPRTTHQYAPLDRGAYIRRFLEHWRPDAVILAESELWPNLILQSRRRGARLALVNARVNAKSLHGWRRRRGAARTLLGAFDWIAAADARTADGLSALAGRPIACLGNLKAAAPPLRAPSDAVDAARAALGGRGAWLAASTHDGEEEIVLAAHARLPEPRPVLIIAPRHPERGEAVAALARGSGLRVGRRAAGDPLSSAQDVYVADTMGEMGLWYALAPVALVGGSLRAGLTGHNPLEPAALGAAILSGPHTASFESLYQELDDAQARRLVTHAESLGAAVLDGLEGRLRAQADAAALVASRGGEVLDAVIAGIVPLLPKAADATA